MSVVFFEVLESRQLMSAVFVGSGVVPTPVSVAKKVVAKPAAKAVPTPVKYVEPLVTNSSFAYKSFATAPLFSAGGPAIGDVNQGAIGDCYLLSTLSAVAKKTPTLIRQDIVSNADGTFTVYFGATGHKTTVTTDAMLPAYSNGHLAYANTGAGGSIWVAIFEKAYAIYKNATNPSYSAINGGWMTDAFTALGLKGQNYLQASSATVLAATLKSDLAANDFTTFGTKSAVSKGSPFIAGHAYEVDSVTLDAKGNVVAVTFRNPWGSGTANNGYVTATIDQVFAVFSGVVVAHV